MRRASRRWSEYLSRRKSTPTSAVNSETRSADPSPRSEPSPRAEDVSEDFARHMESVAGCAYKRATARVASSGSGQIDSSRSIATTGPSPRQVSSTDATPRDDDTTDCDDLMKQLLEPTDSRAPSSTEESNTPTEFLPLTNDSLGVSVSSTSTYDPRASSDRRQTQMQMHGYNSSPETSQEALRIFRTTAAFTYAIDCLHPVPSDV